MEDKSIWNNNNEKARDLNSLEKEGIEKLREKDPAYASFVERHLPLLDASVRFIDKTIADAKSKLEENKKIANDLKNKAKENKDENGKEAPEPMVYDERFAEGLIKEGEILKGKVAGDIVALSQAIISGEKTASRVTFVTAAAEIPKINPNENKDKDKEKDKDKKNDNDKDNIGAGLYKKDERTPEGNENIQDKSSEKEDIIDKDISPNTDANEKTLSKEQQEAKLIAQKSGILKPKTPKTNTNSGVINKEKTNTNENKNVRPAPARNEGR